MAKYDLKITSAGDGDFLQSSNMVNMFKRAQFNLTGEEVLAMAETIKWYVTAVHSQIDTTLRPPKPTAVPSAPTPIATKLKKPAATKSEGETK